MAIGRGNRSARDRYLKGRLGEQPSSGRKTPDRGPVGSMSIAKAATRASAELRSPAPTVKKVELTRSLDSKPNMPRYNRTTPRPQEGRTNYTGRRPF